MLPKETSTTFSISVIAEPKPIALFPKFARPRIALKPIAVLSKFPRLKEAVLIPELLFPRR